ncbi:lipoate--protein ligase family protein [Paludisphaera borealis]|uniref:Octanoyltransferase LipM n=1 Tax=Paludisphaera borealis TaxID=1387353 RepID=A0A1U7CJM9_9BACT|nr:lipoate--protein ligase family protein [Paludisphaera borealis]APW59141.1 Octanoyltransferase LipM [Paludisphaera borealis]
MAIDEALLDLVASDPTVAWLRTYGWSTPTLSLGYFQRWADADAEPRWRSAAKVRRATGGGAIWHEHELTYAIVIPSRHPLSRPNTALYRAVHAAIGSILTGREIEARRHGDLASVSTAAPAPHPFLCFADRDGEDLVAEGSKVVGSAQRRRAGAILQHGSLLLRRSAATPELAGVADLADVATDPRTWSDLVAEPLCRALGMEPVPGDLPNDFQAHVELLEQTVYRDPKWNAKR